MSCSGGSKGPSFGPGLTWRGRCSSMAEFGLAKPQDTHMDPYQEFCGEHLLRALRDVDAGEVVAVWRLRNALRHHDEDPIFGVAP